MTEPLEPRSLLNNLMTAFLVLDSRLHVESLNPAAESLFRLSRRRIQDLPIDELLVLPADSAERLATAPGSGQSFTLNELMLHGIADQESICVNLAVSCLPGEPPRLLLELHRIDQHQHFNEESQQLAQQQAARELVRSLAHEIKNPLGGLRGAAQLLDRQIQDADLKEYTRLIIEQADRLRSLVDRLLGPQRLPRRSLHNIHQITERVYQLAGLQLPEGVRLVRDYDPSLPELAVDADQIEQALLNLVKNAIEALEGRGVVTLRTRHRRLVTIHGRRHRLVLELSVIDNGPGIPDALRDTLFYPMITGKDHGTGLGLSIAQNLVHLHQGRIECHSQPGHTEFVIQLPLAGAEVS